MAFDYGSINLGVKNPFKLEGAVSAIRGMAILIAGVYLLVSAASEVKVDPVRGWILMIFGIIILGAGLRDAGQGIYATLRYFVGRNHPASLARNKSASESSTAKEEAHYTAYTDKQLEEMLMGRKNTTFTEPEGFLSRLIHTLIPKLLFLPYPIRNLAQRLFGAWVATLVALVSYGLVAFVSVMGFAGDAGEIAFPVYSAFLLLYLLFSWRSASRPIERDAQKSVESLGMGSLVKIISLSLILPVLVGIAVSWIMNETKISKLDVDNFIAGLPSLHVGLYLLGLLVLAVSASVIIFIMLRKRLQHAEPVSEVSELRDNWQASIHPNEVFINLDNLVMANRRYKEVPNRVYREIDPKLIGQIDGKGSFKGELLQEVQPIVKPLMLGDLFNKMRLLSLILGNVLFVVAVLLMMAFAYGVIDIYEFSKGINFSNAKNFLASQYAMEGANLLIMALHFLLVGFLVKTFAKLLSNSAHLFFAEMQFESLLVYFKCEGTFTESKLSTGMGIHDSTRSENTVVRSSLSPWIIVSRLTTTIFAATGIKNLEYPRHIMSLNKDDAELASIKEDVMSFLNDREAIASITSERDLGNASQLHQLNQQTRAMPMSPALGQDEQAEAAGFLRQESARVDTDSGIVDER
ncbi:conserved hypothetical protein [Oleispira antarctica RB-8]|uniref:Uncharacterized protein n=1 Tax=Oleispira antarctica RB-8 TaxID=698738 RepID=R4YT78_OLEAN|nr:conserved hypothetical protein [Oleispira antarctica RB-8]